MLLEVVHYQATVVGVEAAQRHMFTELFFELHDAHLFKNRKRTNIQ